MSLRLSVVLYHISSAFSVDSVVMRHFLLRITCSLNPMIQVFPVSWGTWCQSSYWILIHAAMLLLAAKRAVNCCTIKGICDMYSRLQSVLRFIFQNPKESIPELEESLSEEEPTKAQFLLLFYVIDPPKKFPYSCISNSINASLVSYADDILNPSHIMSSPAYVIFSIYFEPLGSSKRFRGDICSFAKVSPASF